MTSSPDPSRAALADKLNAAFEAYLYAPAIDKALARVALEKTLWNNKSGIIAYLRAPLPGSLDLQGAASFIDELIGEDCDDSIRAVVRKTILGAALPTTLNSGAAEYQALRDNLREAWAALAMIRETVETLGPPGAVKAAEHLDGPTIMHEADALVAGIRAIAQTRDGEGKTVEKILFDYFYTGDHPGQHDAIKAAVAALPRAVQGAAATQSFIQNLIRHIETSQIQTHIYHNGDRQSRGIHMSIGENEVQEILADLRALSPNTGDEGQ